MICCRKKNRFILLFLLFVTGMCFWSLVRNSSKTQTKSKHQRPELPVPHKSELPHKAELPRKAELPHTITEPQNREIVDHNVNYFTDLLLDLAQFGSDRSQTEPPPPPSDKSDTRPQEEALISEQPHKPANRPAWLFDNPNILVDPDPTTDVMPDYFDLSSDDMVAEFEKYHDQTKLIMENRRRDLDAACQRISKYARKQDFVFYFPELNMGWCPVFKAGSTNWKQFFCKIYLPDVYEKWKTRTDTDPYCPLGELLGWSVRHRENAARDEGSQSKVEEMKSGLQRSVNFLTVRHPWERLISMYTNKFRDCKSLMFSNPEGHLTKIFDRYRKVDDAMSPDRKKEMIELARLECRKPMDKRVIDQNNPFMNPMGATFREVVEHLTANFKSRVHPDFHWIQVSRVCDVCSKNYTVIEKFETLERDHYYLLKQLGMEGRYGDIAGARGNPSLTKLSPYELVVEYFSELDERLLWDLFSIYKDDFAPFGYKNHFRVRKNPYAPH